MILSNNVKKPVWPGMVIGLIFLGMHGLSWLIPDLGTWFYPLAWWSFIGFVEWVNQYHDQEIFWSQPRKFIQVASISIVFWFIFEIYNLHLGNWYYVGVPESRLLRWVGTVVSFATVLPGLWVVQRWLNLRLPDSLSNRPSPRFPALTTNLTIVSGLVASIAPLFWPDYLFPLVWGGLLLLTDGLAYRQGWRSFRGQWEGGDLKPILSWLGSGIICGFLWEFWNAQALAGWIYTVPYMGEWRLFEMPLLGYLGFPPFAMMVRRLYTVYQDGVWVTGQLGKIGLAVGSTALCLLTLYAMDQRTFVSTRIESMDFVGWTEQERNYYRQQDHVFWQRWDAYFPENQSTRKIELLRLGSMGTETANCLWKRNIRSVPELLKTPTEYLADQLTECRGGVRRFWLRRVKDWKQRA